MTVNNFTVTFWGVRGSRPVPGPGTVIYGGNTPCVEVRIGKRLIILDAGTGITNLGFKLMQEPGPSVGIFLSPMFIGTIYRVFLSFCRLSKGATASTFMEKERKKSPLRH